MTLRLDAEAHILAVARMRDSILPDEAVRVLPLRWRTGISGGKQSADADGRRDACHARGRAHSQVRSLYRVRDRGETAESHIAETRQIDEVGADYVRVRQNEHRVLVEFIGAPTGKIGGTRRKGIEGWGAHIKEPSRERVLLRHDLIDVHAELVLSVMSGEGEGRLADGKLSRSCR